MTIDCCSIYYHNEWQRFDAKHRFLFFPRFRFCYFPCRMWFFWIESKLSVSNDFQVKNDFFLSQNDKKNNNKTIFSHFDIINNQERGNRIKLIEMLKGKCACHARKPIALRNTGKKHSIFHMLLKYVKEIKIISEFERRFTKQFHFKCSSIIQCYRSLGFDLKYWW